MKILGRRQFHAPLVNDFLAEQGGLFVVVQPLRVAAFAQHGGFPIFGHHAEMNLVNVAILDGDFRLRIIPHALDGDLRTLRLNLVNQVVAHPAAGALRVGVATLLGNLVCLHLVAILIQRTGQVKTCPR